ncbi:MAG: 3-oxoacyl-(acyl-carrier-protein) reductase FabG [Syntrophomonadaceae bacterium]|nr:3-oxoacyl-(acyl-carrier-protein) reductase FabG [Bacillota bacterium]
MCEKQLLDKISIITGSASGIGKAIAKRFAAEGSKVIISDVNYELSQKTAEEISGEFGIEAVAIKLNVADFNDCENCVKSVIEKFKKIDILVNNAGITRDNLVLRMTEDEWQKVIDINLKGVFNMTKSVVKAMFKERSGRIINIASVVGLMGNAGQANYSASKGGVIALTKTCAREFAPRNILVNAIAPGFIKTAMTESLSEEVKLKLSEQIPLKRLGLPEDIANCALFLAAAESSYITGEVISVNGGMYM